MSRLKAIALAVLTAALCSTLRGSEDWSLKMLKRVHADSWSAVGKNIIARGHVRIAFKNFDVRADQAVVNLDSMDIEALGNIQVLRYVSSSAEVLPDQLDAVERMPDCEVAISGISTDVFGQNKVSVQIDNVDGNVQVERLVGNLESGYFRFDKALLRFKTFVCKAESGERRANGVIEVNNAEVSACNYLEYGNAHYSISAKRAVIKPFEPTAYGVKHIDTHTGDHTIWIYNGFAKVYGIPVLWLPLFYKPKDESPGICGLSFGKQSDWGYYISAYKRFTFMDYPSVKAMVRGDWYEKRGFGYGLDLDIATENSKTQFSAYSIYDLRPGETDDYEKYRLDVPHGRFDFRLTNLTHITPRLDFRGVAEYVSDYYFLRDFKNGRYEADPQPATYAALEQQFDHLSASIYFRPQLVKYYTTVEKLPEVRLDLPRQQLFGTNLYYQSEMSADYLRMNWIRFDDRSKYENSELEDYDAFRFDTTHFLYYPLRLNWLTVVPRAGMRFTAYSRSSDTDVSSEDLLKLFTAANPQSMGIADLTNYDRDGGSKARFIGELGVEASTKIHNTWQNVRSRFLGLDGLRHVLRPYLNYTFISDPNVSRDNLYYFDDVDRIDRQNFIRFGMENRLQTRSGNSLKEYFSMENYWDLHFQSDGDGNNDIGGLGTKIKMSPLQNLTLSTDLLVDINGNNDVDNTIRYGRDVGVTGLGAKWINRWNFDVTYKPIEDIAINFGYRYNRGYNSRSAYSMGSTLTQIESSGYFNTYESEYSEQLTFGIGMPLTPDRRTMGAFTIGYDFIYGHIRDVGFTVTRRFHCWELMARLGFDYNTDSDTHYTWDTNFSIQARLIGLEMPLNDVQSRMLTSANKAMMGDNDFMW